MLPCLKHAHKTRKKALDHLVSLKTKGGKERCRDLRVYRCQCGAWHVGHAHRQRKIEAVRERAFHWESMALVEEEI